MSEILSRLRKVVAPGLAVALTVTTSSCLTPRLWEDSYFCEFAEPNSEARLALYRGPLPKGDVLACYDERREHSSRLRRRAYWLKANQSRVEQQKKPTFVKENVAEGLRPIPVCNTAPTGEKSAPVYILASENGTGLTLVEYGSSGGSYELPVYQTTRSKVQRAALTPFAAAGDVVIVTGAVAGMAFVFWWAGGGGTLPWTKN